MLSKGAILLQDPNYGSPREPSSPSGGSIGSPIGGPVHVGPQDERTWSMLAHLSALLGLLGLMPFGALIVWLIHKNRSPRVSFHAAQALWNQLAWIAIWIVGSIIGGIFVLVTFGFGLILVAPLGFLLWLAPFVQGCYAAYKVNQGVDYRYPFIADWVDGGRRLA
jgi:uncharacterized protein